MAQIVPGVISDLSQIPTRKHNDLQLRDAAGTHPANTITNTPGGTIIATTAQAAINELDTDLGAHAAATTGIHGLVVTAPTVDQILKFNGTNFINAAGVTANIGPGVVYYLDSTKIIPAGAGPQTFPLETLFKTPTLGIEVDESIVVNNSIALIDQYMYNTAFGTTSINAGAWIFDTYCYVSLAAGTSEVITSIGKVIAGAGTIAITGAGTSRTATVTGGTPFLAGDFNADISQTGYIITPNAVLRITGFTSTSVVTVETLATYTNENGVAYSTDRYLFQSTTGAITRTSVGVTQSSSVQPAFTINATDKLTARYYAKTNNVGDITIHLVHGGNVNYTRFLTPELTLHNELPGVQGGIAGQAYHSTAAEYAQVQTLAADLAGKQPIVRTSTVASSATPTPDADSTDIYTVTALAETATFGAPAGTPINGQKLMIRIKDNATARTLAWNAIYRAGTDVALPLTTVISKTVYCGFIYNSTDSKWDLMAVVGNI